MLVHIKTIAIAITVHTYPTYALSIYMMSLNIYQWRGESGNECITHLRLLHYQNPEIKQFTEVALSLIIQDRCRSFCIPAVPLPAIFSKNISPRVPFDAHGYHLAGKQWPDPEEKELFLLVNRLGWMERYGVNAKRENF